MRTDDRENRPGDQKPESGGELVIVHGQIGGDHRDKDDVQQDADETKKRSDDSQKPADQALGDRGEVFLGPAGDAFLKKSIGVRVPLLQFAPARCWHNLGRLPSRREIFWRPGSVHG